MLEIVYCYLARLESYSKVNQELGWVWLWLWYHVKKWWCLQPLDNSSSRALLRAPQLFHGVPATRHPHRLTVNRKSKLLAAPEHLLIEDTLLQGTGLMLVEVVPSFLLAMQLGLLIYGCKKGSFICARRLTPNFNRLEKRE